MSEWMTIDSAPKDGSQVLLFDGVNVTCGWYIGWGRKETDFPLPSDDVWMVPDGIDFKNWEPTHWMPLPEVPK